MKFKVQCNWLLRTEEEIEINPKTYQHCANIDELNCEIEDYVHQMMTFPKVKNLNVNETEALGVEYWDTTYGEFMLEWQKLKGLSEEL